MTIPVRRPELVPDYRPRSGPAGDRFEGFFREPERDPIPRGGLLDTPAARAWLELIERVNDERRYTFQLPLDGRSGARVTIDGRSLLMISAYDYLGLIGHPEIERAAVDAVERHGTGTGGVRLLTGTTALHRRLERHLAELKGVAAAITFSSGYMATLGLISSLFGPRDKVLLDESAHRSVIDACLLARVPFRRFAHNDPAALERELRRPPRERRTLIVVEGAYSMDGDICPLPDILELKNRYGAFLMVDEAHSLGVLGATGRGLDEHWDVPPREVDIWMGSLSKAIPANGGFLAGRRELVIYLQHGAAPFMFSAALAPSSAAAADQALAVLASEPRRLARLRRNSELLRRGLRRLGYDVGRSETAIIPVILDDIERVVGLASDLLAMGILAAGVIPPAVPRSSARLRLCATAAHTRDDVDEALAAFRHLRHQYAPRGR